MLTMDAAPRMPQMFRRSATNEAPRRSMEEEVERLTPPLEIFVRTLPACDCDVGGFEDSTAALTEVSFDGSFCHHNSSSSSILVADVGASVASDVSSVVDDQPLNTSSGGGERFRLPPRRHSQRRPGARRGVMRWSSMPKQCLKNADSSQDAHTLRRPIRKGSNRDILGDSDSTNQPCGNKAQPRLPTRKRSTDSLLSNVRASSSSETEEKLVPVSANAA